MSDLQSLSAHLIEDSDRYLGNPTKYLDEPHMAELILSKEDGPVFPEQHWLWFFVDQRMDVYPNLMGFHPGWNLGNLVDDPWSEILANYVEDATPGLNAYFGMSMHELVRKHVDLGGRKAYMSANDLLLVLHVPGDYIGPILSRLRHRKLVTS